MFKKYNLYFPLNEKYINKKNFFIKNENKAFFYLLNENYTSKSFIDYIIKDDFLEAEKFISKYSKETFNIELLKDFFNEELTYKILKKVCFNKKNYEKINSFMIMDKTLKFKGIINFHMINEPDKFSKWKIYKIVY